MKLKYDKRRLIIKDKEGKCLAQSVDMRDPWISLRNLWIASSRRNPWMFAQSMDFA